MGQRLVITVTDYNEKAICKIYYHWSAYAYSALEEAQDVLGAIGDEKDSVRIIQKLIRHIENRGGGINGGLDSYEWKYINSKFPNQNYKREGISRNEGLIAISPEGKRSLQSVSEGDLYINLHDGTIDNMVVNMSYEIDELDEYNAQMKEYNADYIDIKVEDIVELPCDPGHFQISEIDELLRCVPECGIAQYDGMICEF